MLSFLFVVIGFTLLVWGADKFVAGSAAAAGKMGVSPLLVGLTIVAFGTSAPELAVSLTASLKGANEIAIGNVIGSNIFNLLMVAGLSAVIKPLAVNKTILKRDWPLSVATAVLMVAMMFADGKLSRADGLILLAFFVIVMAMQIYEGIKNRPSASESTAEVPMRTPMILVNIVLGIACIIIGGQLSVDGASGIARMFGLSETLIGLTIVAIGTSLPELVTSLAAAKKGETDIAVGNVIGSNIFNILLILGASSAVTPISVQQTALIDGAILIALSIIFYIPARKGKISRPVGITMAACYAIYTIYLICR